MTDPQGFEQPFDQVEINSIVDALQAAFDRRQEDEKSKLISDIIQIVERKPGCVFGLSYRHDGKMQWQFRIDGCDGLVFKITLFSWLSGDENGTATVTSRFLADDCRIFFSAEEWLIAGQKGASK
jgi:hypothetical protein